MKNIPQGSDHTLNFAIKDTNGAAIDLGNAEEITVYVYQKRETTLQDFNTANGVDITDAANGLFSVYLDRSSLDNVPEAKLYAEVVIDITNANFESGFKRNVITDIVLGIVVNSVG